MTRSNCLRSFLLLNVQLYYNWWNINNPCNHNGRVIVINTDYEIYMYHSSMLVMGLYNRYGLNGGINVCLFVLGEVKDCLLPLKWAFFQMLMSIWLTCVKLVLYSFCSMGHGEETKGTLQHENLPAGAWPLTLWYMWYNCKRNCHSNSRNCKTSKTFGDVVGIYADQIPFC